MNKKKKKISQDSLLKINNISYNNLSNSYPEDYMDNEATNLESLYY